MKQSVEHPIEVIMCVTMAVELDRTGGLASSALYHVLDAAAKRTVAGNDAVFVRPEKDVITTGAAVGVGEGFGVAVGAAVGEGFGATVGVGAGITGEGVAIALVSVTLLATMPPVGQPLVITTPLEFVAVPITVTDVPDASVPFATFVGNAVAVAGVTGISPQPFAARR